MPHPSLCRLFAGLCAVWLLCPQAARAQPGGLPPQELPLRNLSAFRPTGSNWTIAGRASAHPTRTGPIAAGPGTGVLVNTAPAGQGEHLFTTWEHGDLELELEFLMPRGSNSGIYLQGRYEVQLLDGWGRLHPTAGDAGGIYERWDDRRGPGNQGFEGSPPLQNAVRAPGLWNRLRIVFQAPRFDAAGRKTEPALFRLVELNGVVVQENVRVTGPTRAAAFADERPEGPLMIQGDHGPIAFRGVRYRRYGSGGVTLSDVAYQVREGNFTTLDAFLATPPLREGRARGFDWRLGGSDRFAVTYRGNVHVPADGSYLFGVELGWIDGDPHFTGDTTGGARLAVGGRTVFDRLVRDATDARHVTGTVTLEPGVHPFTLTYFKNRPWTHARAEFYVEGTQTSRQVLNTPASLLDAGAGARILVQPGGEPALVRGFVWHGGGKRVNAASVGDPAGVHYAVDLDRGALLYAWRGPFVDATPMWSGRGTDQVALPLGSLVSFPGLPPVAALPGAGAAWPDGSDAWRLLSYRLDEARRPVFHYAAGGVRLADRLAPEARGGGQALTRRIEVEGPRPDALWLLLAAGEEITDRTDGLYLVDGRHFVELRDAGGAATVIRTHGGRRELLLRLPPGSGPAAVTYSIIW